MGEQFHDILKRNIDDFVHLVYALTKTFPREELYGVTSQLRRAGLSIALNYIEGYARKRKLVMINFLEISYGSLKESQYLLEFSLKEGFMSENNTDYRRAVELAEEIGAMLWQTVKYLEKK